MTKLPVAGHPRRGAWRRRAERVEVAFHLPDDSNTASTGPLVEALARCVRESGCEIASPANPRQVLGLIKQAA